MGTGWPVPAVPRFVERDILLIVASLLRGRRDRRTFFTYGETKLVPYKCPGLGRFAPGGTVVAARGAGLAACTGSGGSASSGGETAVTAIPAGANRATLTPGAALAARGGTTGSIIP